MDFRDMNGFFGGNDDTTGGERYTPPPSRRELPGELVDWVCLTLLAAAVILTVIFWERISDALFYGLLLPLITTGTNLALVILGLMAALAYLRRWIHRHF